MVACLEAGETRRESLSFRSPGRLERPERGGSVRTECVGVWVSSEAERSTEGAFPCGIGANSLGTGSISACLMRRVFFNLDLTEIQGFFIYIWSEDEARDVYGSKSEKLTIRFTRTTLETLVQGASAIGVAGERRLSQWEWCGG